MWIAGFKLKPYNMCNNGFDKAPYGNSWIPTCLLIILVNKNHVPFSFSYCIALDYSFISLSGHCGMAVCAFEFDLQSEG